MTSRNGDLSADRSLTLYETCNCIIRGRCFSVGGNGKIESDGWTASARLAFYGDFLEEQQKGYHARKRQQQQSNNFDSDDEEEEEEEEIFIDEVEE